MLTQNTGKGKIIFGGGRGGKEKQQNQTSQQANEPQQNNKQKKPQTPGTIHMPICAVVNEQCQLIDLNVCMGILQKASASCSHAVKKSRQTPDLSEEENGIQQMQKPQWISQKRKKY